MMMMMMMMMDVVDDDGCCCCCCCCCCCVPLSPCPHGYPLLALVPWATSVSSSSMGNRTRRRHPCTHTVCTGCIPNRSMWMRRRTICSCSTRITMATWWCKMRGQLRWLSGDSGISAKCTITISQGSDEHIEGCMQFTTVFGHGKDQGDGGWK